MEELRNRIAKLELENRKLRERNQQLEFKHESALKEKETESAKESVIEWTCDHDLTKQQIERYSRQLVLPSFGIKAQSSLLKSRVLVIGAGGLGSSALLYLAAAGIGQIGIVDRDKVALNNLHRQIIHSEYGLGMDKTVSAKSACLELNSSVDVKLFQNGLNPENAVDIVSQFDVVIDCSDNVPTRYLANDACVVLRKPLVFGAAIGTDGQLTVFNYGADGLCYRCLFPKAPPLNACSSCTVAGVLGPVPGAVGVFQALEAIKVISQVHLPVFSLVTGFKTGTVLSRKLMTFDFLSMDIRQIKLRAKREDCICCGMHPAITVANLAEYDYFAFTGQQFCEMSNSRSGGKAQISARLTPKQLAVQWESYVPRPTIVDVRPSTEFEICHFRSALNFPFDRTDSNFSSLLEICKQKEEIEGQSSSVIVICRKGNDSQVIINRLQENGIKKAKDLIGGLEFWHESIDSSFCMY